MHWTKFAAWACIGLLSVIGTGCGAVQAQCLALSPTIVAGDDPYAEIEVTQLTPEQHTAIKALLMRLDGEWRGRAVEVDCRHPSDPERYREEVTALRAKATVDRNGSLHLYTRFDNDDTKTTRFENFRLYLTEQYLRVNTTSALGNIQFIALTPQRIAFLYRRLLTGPEGKGAIRKEIHIALAVGSNGFTLTRRTYTQGRLSSSLNQTYTRP